MVESWQQHQWLARAVWALALLAPPVVSGVGTWFLRPLFVNLGGFWGGAFWVVQLAVVGIGLALLTERGVRRLIPLSHLLRLTLVFPDKAPSRYGVALRTGTIRQQQAIIETVREDGFSGDDVEAFEQLVALVMALGRHERLTRGHTERVRAYSDLLAVEMGLPDEDREKLHWAALLHDIGKLGVPSELLSLPGRPSDEQWQIIKQHPALGAVMVERFADWLGDWRFAAGDHHERWDGGGYPKGVAGVDISLAGRIVAIADAYDVITSTRSYKKATPADAARAELVRCAGTQFDPAVVRAFLRISTGDLRAGAGRVAWTTSLPGLLAKAGQTVTLPLTAAAGVLGLPLLAASVGLADEADPFSILAPDTNRAVIEDVLEQEPALALESAPDAGADSATDPDGTIPDGEDRGSGDSDDPDATVGPEASATPTPVPGTDGTGSGAGGNSGFVTPTVPGVPTVGPIPTVGLPDLPIDLPDIALPTVTLPDVPLPTVTIPDVLPTVTLPVPTVTIPVVPLPTPTVIVPLPTPTVNVALPTPTVIVPLPTPTLGVPGIPGL